MSDIMQDLRIQREALLALQEAAEAFIIGHMEGIEYYHKFLSQ